VDENSGFSNERVETKSKIEEVVLKSGHIIEEMPVLLFSL
jgi:hypothetical protein